MRQSHLILSNALIIWLSRVLLLVPQLILVPYLIGTIGEAGYGVYALIWSLLMGVDRLERSLQLGVVKYSAAFLAEGRMNEVNRVVSSSFVYSILLAVVASASIFVAAFCSDPTGNLGASLLVVGALILFIIPLTPYIAVIQSRQRYYVGVVAETLSKYSSLGIIFAWFTLATPSVEALIVITTALLFISRLAQLPVAYRLVPGLRNRPALFDRRAFQLILTFGGMTAFVALCGIANTTGVRWLMGILVSTGFVAHLAIMLMPGTLLRQIVQAMTTTIMPATSAYEASGNARMLRELLLRSIRYTTVIVLAGLLVAALLIEDVLALWVGSDYAFLAPYTLAIFASVGFLMTTSSAHHMLEGLGKLRTTVCIALAGKVLVPLTLIITLFSSSQAPYLAVTVGLVGGNAISGLLNLVYAAKTVDAGVKEMLMRIYAQPLLAAGAAAFAPLVFVALGRVEGPIVRSGLAAFAVVAFLLQMYIVFATREERRQSREIFHAAHNRFAAIFRKPPSVKSSRL